MATGTRGRSGGLLDGLVYDLKRFHEIWMGLLFPRQVGAEETVLGKWKPRSRLGWYKYRLWALIGLFVVAALYPAVLVGTIIRFNVRRIDNTAARIGALGVLVLAAVVWGALSVLAHVQLPYEGFVAVVAAGIVATASAVAAVFFARVGGRAPTVLLAYPLAVTGIFLPPSVAALFLPVLAEIIFPLTESLSIWLLGTVFEPLGLRWLFHAYFDLEGVMYALVWFAISFPVGWLLGGIVTLTDVVRPKN